MLANNILIFFIFCIYWDYFKPFLYVINKFLTMSILFLPDSVIV